MQELSVGDLIQLDRQACDDACTCFFCYHNSSGMGIVTDAWIGEDDLQSAIAQFDCGPWSLMPVDYRLVDVLSNI